MRADDELIIQNYMPVFTSSLSKKLPEPMFKSTENADFYDTMMVNGAFIQLGSFLLNLQTINSAAANIKTKQEYESSKKIKQQQYSSLETLEDDVVNYVTMISEQRPDLLGTEFLKIMSLQAQVKDIAARRKNDSLRK